MPETFFNGARNRSRFVVRTLDVHIQRLRRKVKLFNLGGEIQTILRHGYCWVTRS